MITPNIIEYLRQVSVEGCFDLAAFQSGWPTWKSKINETLGHNFNENDILNLGDHLAEIFFTTRSTGRSQGSLAGGGYGWEGLICWYLNLCFAGTNGVAIRKTSDLPEPLRDSISVNYGNFRSNTESDIVVVIFPDEPDFNNDRNSISVLDSSGSEIPILLRNRFNNIQLANRLTEIHFDNFEIGIIQCKTNWNDNAQIPMLWSMIYQATTFTNNAISIGRNSYSINDIRNFTYSFMTVPTNDLSKYQQTSTSVNRVRNLTGGNYWGFPTSNSIASSLKEIFNNNFRNAFPSNARQSIRSAIPNLNSNLSYFNLI